MHNEKRKRGRPSNRTVLRAKRLLARNPAGQAKAANHDESSGDFYCASWILSGVTLIPVFFLLHVLGMDRVGFPLSDILRYGSLALIYYLMHLGFRRWNRLRKAEVERLTLTILHDEGALLDFLDKRESLAAEREDEAARPRTMLSPRTAPRNSRQLLAELIEGISHSVYKRIPSSFWWHMLGGDIRTHVRRVVEGEFTFPDRPPYPQAPALPAPPDRYAGARRDIENSAMFLARCYSIWPLPRCRGSQSVRAMRLKQAFEAVEEPITERDSGRIRQSRRASEDQSWPGSR